MHHVRLVAAEGSAASDVDNRASAVWHKVRDRFATDVSKREQIHLHRRLPCVSPLLVGRVDICRWSNTGVVHHHVDRTDLVDGLVKQFRRCAWLRQIHLKHNRVISAGCSHFLRLGRAAAVRQDNSGTSVIKRECRRRTYTSRRAGYQNGLATEIDHLLTVLSCPRRH